MKAKNSKVIATFYEIHRWDDWGWTPTETMGSRQEAREWKRTLERTDPNEYRIVKVTEEVVT